MVTGGPDDQPAFLDPERAEAIGYVGADATPNFDYELTELPPLDETLPARGKGPSRGYEERHRLIAKYHAIGYTNNQIARHLGYSAPGVSLALQKPWTQAEVARIRDQMHDPDVINRLKAAGADAIDHIHRSILDPLTKDEIRSTNARWTIEKLTGKAKQEVSVESGTLSNFMELLKDMRSRSEAVDVTPTLPVVREATDAEPQPADQWDSWLSANL